MQFWLNNPRILFEKAYIFDLWPQPTMDFVQKMNAISRLVIILTVLGLLMTKSFKVFLSGFITLAVICYLNYIKRKGREGMSNVVVEEILDKNYQLPEKKNPLMNVMLTDYSDNPDRNSGAPAFNPIIEDEVNEKAKESIISNFDDSGTGNKLFANLGDNLEFEHSMRNFYTTPASEIPNNQNSFANFCYGSMKSCKEDNLECV